MTHWYTADTHFGDPGILTFFERPFASAPTMDAALIEAIAARVRPDDDLWIVGDFTRAEGAVAWPTPPGCSRCCPAASTWCGATTTRGRS